jgi:hypothetical protein
VLGHEGGLEPVGERGQALEVAGVESAGRAERQAHAVDRDRIVAADPLQGSHRRAPAHVVLGVNLQPAHGGPGGDDLGDVRRA